MGRGSWDPSPIPAHELHSHRASRPGPSEPRIQIGQQALVVPILWTGSHLRCVALFPKRRFADRTSHDWASYGQTSTFVCIQRHPGIWRTLGQVGLSPPASDIPDRPPGPCRSTYSVR